MTVIEMLKQEIGLDENQAQALKAELKALEAFFDKNFEDSKSFFEAFYAKFEDVIAPHGFKKGDAKQAEPLVSSLYRQGKFKILVTYIIPAYYQSGGDSDIFKDTYEQMLNHH